MRLRVISECKLFTAMVFLQGFVESLWTNQKLPVGVHNYSVADELLGGTKLGQNLETCSEERRIALSFGWGRVLEGGQRPTNNRVEGSFYWSEGFLPSKL